jgi:tetratricopeptide (TPR) repeat protein
MAGEKMPNARLAAVMAEAGVSNKGLAARVRELATADGRSMTPDHTSVTRWLKGTIPNDPAPSYIAKALSIKLGRRVNLADIGFEPSSADAEVDVIEDGAQYQQDALASVALLEKLTGSDLDDQGAVLHADWNQQASPNAITGYLFGQSLQATFSTVSPSAGSPLAVAIRSTAAQLMDLDFRFGGGHTRKLLLFYFKSEVAPQLKLNHPESVRREIFSAAAEVVQLLGWTAYDAGRHGAAQRYFMQALRLAREADDHMLGGRLLGNLSHQANYLGKFSDAVQFARAAQTATFGKATSTVVANFLAMEARALASSRQQLECVKILNRAEQFFEQRVPEDDPDWISYFNAEELAGEAAHCFRDLRRPEETRLFATKAIEPTNTPPRTMAFINMVMASGALTAGNLDEAVSLAVTAVDLAGPLQSKRYVRYLTDFSNDLSIAHEKDPLTASFNARVKLYYPTIDLAKRG